MKVLIQHCVTKLYLNSLHGWTPLESEALDLMSAREAVKVCLESKFSNVQIVLQFGSSQLDFYLSSFSGMQANQSAQLPP